MDKDYKTVEIENNLKVQSDDTFVKKTAKISRRLFTKIKDLRVKVIDKQLENIENSIDHIIETPMPKEVLAESKNMVKEDLEKLNAKVLRLSNSRFVSDNLAKKIKLTSQRITTLKAKCEDASYDMGDDDLANAINSTVTKENNDDDLANAINTTKEELVVTPPPVKTEVEQLKPIDGEYHFNKDELNAHVNNNDTNQNDDITSSREKLSALISEDAAIRKEEENKARQAIALENRKRSEELREKFGTPDNLETIEKATREALKAYLEDKKTQLTTAEPEKQPTVDVEPKYEELNQKANIETNNKELDLDSAYDWLKESGLLDKKEEPENLENTQIEEKQVENKPSYWEQVEMVAKSHDRNNAVETKNATVEEYQPVENAFSKEKANYESTTTKDKQAYNELLDGLTNKYINDEISVSEFKENFNILVEMYETSKKENEQKFENNNKTQAEELVQSQTISVNSIPSVDNVNDIYKNEAINYVNNNDFITETGLTPEQRAYEAGIYDALFTNSEGQQEESKTK